MEINLVCLPENYPPYFFRDIHNRFPETFIVAERDGVIIGYIMCRIERGLSEFKTFGFSKKGHVISIAVLPEYRLKGIGLRLINTAIQKMLLYEAKECFLEVRVSNTPAVELYKTLGFKIKSHMSSYYADGEPAYKMTKELNSEDRKTTSNS
jgi:ribosomal-protein-alanine N-acetyltransferase